ncbi:hypothetical protein [Mesorhizobium sp. B2-7-1]|uniref:hypothetical protein n=1 Tax=Mesorhizobium sp. B2-7-1 TaxID=2589909 RepID=UPI001127CA1F|nr:hypothetical protein [Mesorhizobium sp. B2-7-1]TPJ52275.1 hypothetical protein FJ471_28235 [Mesorhizobium sp. B2-7-1]
MDSTISLATSELRLSTWSVALRKVAAASFSTPLISLAVNISDASSSSSKDSLICNAAKAIALGLLANITRMSPLRPLRDFFFAISISQHMENMTYGRRLWCRQAPPN